MKKIKFLIVLLVSVSAFLIAEDASNEFDIMYVYTAAAKNRAGGVQKIREAIDNSVNRINQSFINSNMNVRVNLVHTEEVDYPLDIWEWKGDAVMQARFRQVHQHLIGKNDGYMDNVHALRDKYSADMVQLFIANAAYGGLANTMFKNNHSYESTAFTTIGGTNPGGNASVHELGHIMGNQHDIYNTSSNGTYSYSHGYGSPLNTFRTIMSYGKACNGVKNSDCEKNSINYWSSPIQYYNGEVMGAYYADARQTILNNAHTIANFRQRPVTTAPIVWANYQREPERTFESNSTITVEGETGYDVYVNGVKMGTINSDGYVEIVVSITTVYNDFEVKLQHVPSGTFSESESIQIIKLLDTDNDGVFDYIEDKFGLDPNNSDSDGDGYSDFEEYGVEDIGGGASGGAYRSPKDTDNDGIIDALDEDSDNDGVTDKDKRLGLLFIPIYYLILN